MNSLMPKRPGCINTTFKTNFSEFPDFDKINSFACNFEKTKVMARNLNSVTL